MTSALEAPLKHHVVDAPVAPGAIPEQDIVSGRPGSLRQRMLEIVGEPGR